MTSGFLQAVHVLGLMTVVKVVINSDIIKIRENSTDGFIFALLLAFSICPTSHSLLVSLEDSSTPRSVSSNHCYFYCSLNSAKFQLQPLLSQLREVSSQTIAVLTALQQLLYSCLPLTRLTAIMPRFVLLAVFFVYALQPVSNQVQV